MSYKGSSLLVTFEKLNLSVSDSLMATVRDLKNQVTAEAGGSEAFHKMARLEEYWRKLNSIGARNMNQPGHTPQDVPDIDADVNLSEIEFNQLLGEFRQLFSEGS